MPHAMVNGVELFYESWGHELLIFPPGPRRLP